MIRRPSTSSGPPGAVGTMILTVLFGKLSAWLCARRASAPDRGGAERGGHDETLQHRVSPFSFLFSGFRLGGHRLVISIRRATARRGIFAMLCSARNVCSTTRSTAARPSITQPKFGQMRSIGLSANTACKSFGKRRIVDRSEPIEFHAEEVFNSLVGNLRIRRCPHTWARRTSPAAGSPSSRR